MKIILKIFSAIVILAGFLQCTRSAENLENSISNKNIPSITANEKDELSFMFEEEKLARDTYIYLFTKWGNVEFKNIQNSEQSHMNAIENLLTKYNIPYQNLEQGKFVNQDLQTLYNQLITKGNSSTIEALKVGATVEDVDIKDLENFSSQTQNSLIINVFGNLTCGSRNHMRAFSSALKNLGVTYNPQFISQAEYNSIISSPNEQCGK